MIYNTCFDDALPQLLFCHSWLDFLFYYSIHDSLVLRQMVSCNTVSGSSNISSNINSTISIGCQIISTTISCIISSNISCIIITSNRGDELGTQVNLRIFFSLSSLFKYSCHITGAFIYAKESGTWTSRAGGTIFE